jgi:hypothetical protein
MDMHAVTAKLKKYKHAKTINTSTTWLIDALQLKTPTETQLGTPSNMFQFGKESNKPNFAGIHPIIDI